VHTKGGTLNQILQTLLILGIITLVSTIAFNYAQNNLEGKIISQHDKMQNEKNQSIEEINMIEVMQSPLRVDIVNIGLDTIFVKKVFVDGIDDVGYYLTDNTGVVTSIEQNQITTINFSLSGNNVKLITTNNKVFSFE